MFPVDCLVTDLVFAVNAQPSVQALVAAVGSEDALKALTLVDPDLDFPEYEMEISPTVPLRRRGERRLLLVDEAGGSLRRSPDNEPIVPRDLRPARDRLVALVEQTGARFGRVGAFGSWGDAAVMTRSARELRGLCLIPWALDATVDLEGRRRANPLSKREFEAKLAAYPKRLEEIDEAALLALIPPAMLARRGDLLVVDLISDRDGSWDTRKSIELIHRLAAIDRFARILGAPIFVAPPAAHEASARPAAKPAEPAPPPPPAGPPLQAVELGERVVLLFPEERFDLDAITALGKLGADVVTSGDRVSGPQREAIARLGAGFLAPLAFLSEVFLEGKPLDKRRFAAEARPEGAARVLEAHLPRFGPVLVVEMDGARFVTSEIGLKGAEVADLLSHARR